MLAPLVDADGHLQVDALSCVVSSMPANTSDTGTVTAAAGTVVATLPGGCAAVGLQITGTWVGQLEFEASTDGTNYAGVEASNGTATVNATTGNDIFILPGAGYAKVRVRASSWTSGTANITFLSSVGSAAAILTGSLPAGDNNIGNVDIVTLPSGNLGMQAMAASLSMVPASDITDGTYIGDIKFGEALPAGTNAIGKLAANSGVDIGDVDILSIAAGDNNIGNVDIVTLPAGNLGMQAMAASLSMTPASDITDGTYIGDIKFGEALPAGSNAVGKLAANSGVDIGDVDVTSISAGTNTIGGVISMPSTSTAYDGTTSATIKRATGLAASGTTAMVAAVASYQIRVLAIALISTSTTVTNVYIANADNNIIGDASNPIPLGTDADGDMIPGFILPFNPGGWFQTDTDNEALNLIISAAQDVIYAVTYIEVT
jgi:hypothetical protein